MLDSGDAKAIAVRTDHVYIASAKAAERERTKKRRLIQEEFAAEHLKSHKLHMERCARLNEAEREAVARLDREFKNAEKRTFAKVFRRLFGRAKT